MPISVDCRVMTWREKNAKEARKARDEWEDEARGKSWAKKLKDMHKLVKDLEPLIDMANT